MKRIVFGILTLAAIGLAALPAQAHEYEEWGRPRCEHQQRFREREAWRRWRHERWERMRWLREHRWRRW